MFRKLAVDTSSCFRRITIWDEGDLEALPGAVQALIFALTILAGPTALVTANAFIFCFIQEEFIPADAVTFLEDQILDGEAV